MNLSKSEISFSRDLKSKFQNCSKIQTFRWLPWVQDRRFQGTIQSFCTVIFCVRRWLAMVFRHNLLWNRYFSEWNCTRLQTGPTKSELLSSYYRSLSFLSLKIFSKSTKPYMLHVGWRVNFSDLNFCGTIKKLKSNEKLQNVKFFVLHTSYVHTIEFLRQNT